MHWRHSGSPVRTKFKQTLSVQKVMCTVFWDRKGILLIDFLPRARRTAAVLTEFGWELFDHPPYSPDLAPSDFHVFLHLKKFSCPPREYNAWCNLPQKGKGVILYSEFIPSNKWITKPNGMTSGEWKEAIKMTANVLKIGWSPIDVVDVNFDIPIEWKESNGKNITLLKLYALKAGFFERKKKEELKALKVADLGDQDKSWCPHKVCRSCVEELRSWKNGKRKSLPFGIPMIWREPTNHGDNCYFCTAIRLIPHGPDIPVLLPPEQIHCHLDPEALKLNLQWIILMNQAMLVMIDVLI
ncbi:hypothetical protein ANN_09526 [Periplaneta americana]|uniref:Uncharacterized protein n=1 Tax=Periplaneta americana TaxID=6978 RepID=A0ABQ8TLJ1_PERAM|nr:hypothetical protein ANN_09526 [Periplaneta americana]